MLPGVIPGLEKKLLRPVEDCTSSCAMGLVVPMPTMPGPDTVMTVVVAPPFDVWIWTDDGPPPALLPAARIRLPPGLPAVDEPAEIVSDWPVPNELGWTLTVAALALPNSSPPVAGLEV